MQRVHGNDGHPDSAARAVVVYGGDPSDVTVDTRDADGAYLDGRRGRNPRTPRRLVARTIGGARAGLRVREEMEAALQASARGPAMRSREWHSYKRIHAWSPVMRRLFFATLRGTLSQVRSFAEQRNAAGVRVDVRTQFRVGPMMLTSRLRGPCGLHELAQHDHLYHQMSPDAFPNVAAGVDGADQLLARVVGQVRALFEAAGRAVREQRAEMVVLKVCVGTHLASLSAHRDLGDREDADAADADFVAPPADAEVDGDRRKLMCVDMVLPDAAVGGGRLAMESMLVQEHNDKGKEEEEEWARVGGDALRDFLGGLNATGGDDDSAAAAVRVPWHRAVDAVPQRLPARVSLHSLRAKRSVELVIGDDDDDDDDDDDAARLHGAKRVTVQLVHQWNEQRHKVKRALEVTVHPSAQVARLPAIELRGQRATRVLECMPSFVADALSVVHALGVM